MPSEARFLDDFAAMEQVVRRRYAKVLENGGPFPDLIVIDGGKGQLNAAYAALETVGLSNLVAIGLAKKEELVFTRDSMEPLALDSHGAALRLLQRIRDEAHRFAITFHRQSRRKRDLQSELDVVPGIGLRRRKDAADRVRQPVWRPARDARRAGAGGWRQGRRRGDCAFRRQPMSLELTRDEREQLGRAALDWALTYFDEQSRLPIYPSTSPNDLTSLLAAALPLDPQDPATVMADFEQIAANGRHNGHPRMFGYVQSAGQLRRRHRRPPRVGAQPERHVMAIGAGGDDDRAPGDRVAEGDGRLRS